METGVNIYEGRTITINPVGREIGQTLPDSLHKI